VLNKKPYGLLVLFECCALALFLSRLINVHVFYWFGFICFSAILWLAHLDVYPFSKDGKIKFKIAYFSSCLIPLGGANALLNSNYFPFWYPKDNRLWGFIPYLFLGFVSLKFKLAIKFDKNKS
jgi:hypothetical protein